MKSEFTKKELLELFEKKNLNEAEQALLGVKYAKEDFDNWTEIMRKKNEILKNRTEKVKAFVDKLNFMQFLRNPEHFTEYGNKLVQSSFTQDEFQEIERKFDWIRESDQWSTFRYGTEIYESVFRLWNNLILHRKYKNLLYSYGRLLSESGYEIKKVNSNLKDIERYIEDSDQTTGGF